MQHRVKKNLTPLCLHSAPLTNPPSNHHHVKARLTSNCTWNIPDDSSECEDFFQPEKNNKIKNKNENFQPSVGHIHPAEAPVRLISAGTNQLHLRGRGGATVEEVKEVRRRYSARLIRLRLWLISLKKNSKPPENSVLLLCHTSFHVFGKGTEMRRAEESSSSPPRPVGEKPQNRPSGSVKRSTTDATGSWGPAHLSLTAQRTLSTNSR